MVPTDSPTETPTTLLPTVSDFPSQSPTIFCEPECVLIDGQLSDERGSIFGRIRRNETTSSCDGLNQYPGQFGNVVRYYESIGPFCNRRPEEVCVTINWNWGSCIDQGDVQVHPVAYTMFNTSDLSQGYLGDVGSSNSPQFSFNLDGFGTFFMVFQQVFPGEDGVGCSFQFQVDFGRCNQGAAFFPISEDFRVAELGNNVDPMLKTSFGRGGGG